MYKKLKFSIMKTFKIENPMIEITFMDGNKRQYPKMTTCLEVANSISPSLGKMAIAAKVGENLVDLTAPLEEDASLEIITGKSPESLHVLRHTTAHIFAQAVTRLYKDAKIAIGPAIENGFYFIEEYTY